MPALNWGDGEEGIDAGAEMSMEGLDPSTLAVRNPCPSVDQLMLGGASIGCLFKEVKPDQARECIEKAVELGIRYVDTAPWYGAGLSETRLGEALSTRLDVKISTKCGRIVLPKRSLHIVQPNHIEKDYEGHFYTDNYHNNRVCWTYTGDGIRESQSQSAARLQREVIDCLRLHDAENKERFDEATAPGGAVETMIALKADGKVKEISLGMNSAKYIVEYLKRYPGKFDNIMLSNCFNLIDHNCIPLLLECQSQGVKITNVGIFASGLLWGGEHYMYDSAVPDDVKEKVTKWKALAEKYELTLPQVAMCFALLPDIVNYVAFGTSRASAVEENVALCGKTVPLALWKEAQAAGIMNPHLPLPADEVAEPAAKKAKN